MIDILKVLIGGSLLSSLYFAGLWFTVHKGLKENPMIFVGSHLLRTALLLAGFALISRGDWRKWLICLVGFQLARLAATYAT